MTFEQITAFSIYAVVTLFTPGPNNIMLLTSGLNFGLRRTVPHICGVAGGFTVMVFLVGAGLGAVFSAYPVIYTVMKWLGTAYLLWLAWKVANTGRVSADVEEKNPMTLLAAAMFQWVNPKAWMMAIGAVSIYVPHEHYFANVCIVSAIFCAIGFPSAATWAACGTMFRWLFEHETYMRIFNIVMALLLVASAYPTLVEIVKPFFM